MVSLWQATAQEPPPIAPRTPLDGDLDVDVAIVGAGFTGLWTAYYLAGAQPDLRVAVFERETVGFGASGRNGGWCSALLPMGADAIAARHGVDAARRMQSSMFDTIDEIGRVTVAEGIDCDFAKGGTIVVARNPAQVPRLQGEVETARRYGFGEDDVRWLDAVEAAARIGATDVLGGTFTPHCAAIHPLRLVHGLAAAVERRGVRIYEYTPVESIAPRTVCTAVANVRADVVVRATEAWSSTLPGARRSIVPIYSLMVATEPLPADVLDQIGLGRRETFADGRRLVIYGQRTVDGRLAFGGRGAPYHFGSKIRPAYDQHAGVHAALRDTLVELFPVLRDVRITHQWGGAVGAPRDWTCSVGLDQMTGLAWAGGYVGDGVATTNLAGRTLADLITGTASPLVDLAWVGHRSRNWEPEPLRWMGINAMVRLPGGADAYEQRTGRPERWRSRILDRVLGH